jgi:hypothetical protein
LVFIVRAGDWVAVAERGFWAWWERGRVSKISLHEQGAFIADHAAGSIVMMPREEALRLINDLIAARRALRFARGFVEHPAGRAAQKQVLAVD